MHVLPHKMAERAGRELRLAQRLQRHHHVGARDVRQPRLHCVGVRVAHHHSLAAWPAGRAAGPQAVVLGQAVDQ